MSCLGKKKKELKLPEEQRTGTWHLKKVFEYCEKKYGSLLRSLPECIQVYEGVNRTGELTIKRYSIVFPPDPEKVEADVADDDVDEEDNTVELTPAQVHIHASCMLAFLDI
jgi:hypothetical protein